MKNIVVLAIAVFVGIVIYRKLTTKGPVKAGTGNDLFNGPDVDPVTGAYLPPAAKEGTVEFSAQDN